jgi:RNA polymerase sigma-70 factor (ECF subfamily)
MTAFPTASSSEIRSRFESLVLPVTKSLYNTALRLSRRPEDASDLVQETFLRAYRTLSHFEVGTNIKAWLFTILYSIFVNRYRKEQREPETISIAELEEKFQRTIDAIDPTAHIAVFQNSSLGWEGPEVHKALARLPEEFYTVVLLVDVEELSYEEAAVVMNCPLGTLRSRLFRARKLLYLELQGYARRMGYLSKSAD